MFIFLTSADPNDLSPNRTTQALIAGAQSKNVREQSLRKKVDSGTFTEWHGEDGDNDDDGFL